MTRPPSVPRSPRPEVSQGRAGGPGLPSAPRGLGTVSSRRRSRLCVFLQRSPSGRRSHPASALRSSCFPPSPSPRPGVSASPAHHFHGAVLTPASAPERPAPSSRGSPCGAARPPRAGGCGLPSLLAQFPFPPPGVSPLPLCLWTGRRLPAGGAGARFPSLPWFVKWRRSAGSSPASLTAEPSLGHSTP